MKKLIFLTFLLFLTFSCSTNDDNISPSCFQDENRKIIAVFTNTNGYVINDDLCGTFILTGGSFPKGRYALNLIPCKLPSDLKKDSLKITYSGYLFESFELEDECAQKFEITDIRISNTK